MFLLTMDFAEIIKQFKETLLKNKFKIIRENKNSIVVYNKLSYCDEPIKFEQKDIEEFSKFLEKKDEYNNFGEYGFCNTNFCEHKVTHIGSRMRPMFPMHRRLRDEMIFGKKQKSKPYIVIGPCSKEFIFYFLINETRDEMFYREFRSRSFDGKLSYFSDILSNFFTIQVYNINENNTHSSSKVANQLINSALFELSLIKDTHLKLEEPRTRDLFRFRREIINKELDVPKIKYDNDIIKHYSMGLEGSHPVLSFLSFYQVIEGYFIKASNSELIKDTQKYLLDPRFNVKQESTILELIDDIQKFKLENSELNQLKIVLNNYIDKNKTIEFINKFETKKGEKYFSGKKTIFGENLKLILENDNLVSSLAKRIYTIRCAIVHSKMGHNNVKYIPSSKNDKILLLETPLMRFLAEEIIINSSIKI